MISYLNSSQKISQIKNGNLSLKENVKFFVSEIDKKKELNAFNFVFENDALKNAEKIEEKIKSGNHGKLAGMVIAIKDVLSIKDKPLTCSSNILRNFEAIYNSTAVQKLIDEDAIIIGKTNCDEFAMGSSNENSVFGPVLNPYDENRVPGGSSGGSAAAVAASLCDAALGTDTGGSIRQPAAFCGVYGLKPTYGRVSRFGLTAYASSFDSIGPITKNIEDAASILTAISGFDEHDSTSSKIEVPDYNSLLKDDVQKIKIGLPKEYFGEGLSSGIKNAIDLILSKLKNKNIEIIDISLPHTEYTISAYYIIATAEASSNLARYYGAKFGLRSKEGISLEDMYKNSRTEGFSSEVKKRIMLGTYVLSAGYYDAYYKKAQKVRRLIKNDFDEAFKKVDIILTPTTPTTAFKFGEKLIDPLQMYLTDVYTTSANLAGIPGLNVPIGKDKNRLPIGMQLLADQFKEFSLFQLGYYLQNKII